MLNSFHMMVKHHVIVKWMLGVTFLFRAWCDVLVLPTLSENFGLVVAEALERGKRVITTDGAPAWDGQAGVVYLKGYRDGTNEQRVELLKRAIGSLC